MSDYLEAIEDLLREWGRAARADTVRVGYKPGVLANLNGSTLKSASISNEDYQSIDEIISRLKLVDSKLHDVATLLFIQDRTYTYIAKLLRTSKSTISQYKQAIIAYAAGSMNDI